MKQAVSEEPSTLFEVQLRLGSEIIPVKVLNSDDRASLTDRVCRDHRIDAHYKQLIQNKIIDALNRIIRSASIEQSLLVKVERFLNRQRRLKHRLQQVEEAPSSWSNASSAVYSGSEDHSYDRALIGREQRLFEKELHQQSSRHGSNTKGESRSAEKSFSETQENILDAYIPSFGGRQRRFGGELLNNSQDKPKESYEKSADKIRSKLSPPTPNTGLHTGNPTAKQFRTHEDLPVGKSAGGTTKSKKWRPSGAPTQFDADLLQSYRNVYAKCRNPAMRDMVKRIIAELEIKQKVHKEQNHSLSSIKINPFPEYHTRQIQQKRSVESSDQMRSKTSNNPANLFSFQQIEFVQEQPSKAPAISLVNNPYLKIEDRAANVRRITTSSPTNPFKGSEAAHPTADMSSLDDLLARNQKLLERTTPKATSTTPVARGNQLSRPYFDPVRLNARFDSVSPPKRVQFTDQRKPPAFVGSQVSLTNILHGRIDRTTLPFRRYSPERHHSPIRTHEPYQSLSFRQIPTYSLERAAKETESIPVSIKNSIIKPSSVTCIRTNPNNSRRFKYLEDSEYCQ